MKITLSPDTNLPEVSPKKTIPSHGGFAITKEMLNAPNYERGVDYTPYDSMNFTNVYQDDISKYQKYNVPTTRYFNWDDQRAKNQGTGEKWVNGLAKAGVTTVGAVVENTLGVLFGLGELVTGGAYYDNWIGRSVDKTNEWMREEMPNYRSQADLDASTWQKLGTANFWADTVANGLGYSIGSIATIALTGGTGLITRGMSAVANSKRLMSMYNTTKAIANGTKLEKVLKPTKFLGLNTTKQGFFTASNMIESGLMMSLAEASVEARETQKHVYEDILQKVLSEKGFTHASQLSDIDLKDIEDASYAAANSNFLRQLPVLAGTNLLMFGRQVTGFKPVSKVNKDVVFDNGLNKVVSSIENQGMFRNTLSRLKPTGAEALTEAAQEGWQFGSNILSSDYHTDKYFNGGIGDLTASLYKGIKETFGSQEGLESMLVGAIVGGGMAGVRSTIQGQFKQRKAAAKYAADVMNGGFLTNAANQSLQFSAQVKVALDMENARKAGDIKAFKDAQFKLIQYNALAAIENGTYDIFKQKLEDSKTLNDAEFAKMFGFSEDLTIEEQTGDRSKTEVIKNIQDKLDKFKEVYDTVNERFPSLPKASPLARMRMSEAERKADDAVYNKRHNLRNELILSASGIENRNERMQSIQKQMQDILGEASKINGIPMVEEDFNLYNLFRKQQPQEPGEEEGEYNAIEELNAVRDKLNSVVQSLRKKGATAAIDPFIKLGEDYLSLFMDNSVAIDRYNKLSSNEYFQDLFEETVKQTQTEAQQVAKDKKAKEDIENAKTAQETRESVPEDASTTVKNTAKVKAKVLTKEEDAARKKYLDLHKNQSLKDRLKKLQSIKLDELPPAEQQGLITAITVLENKLKKNKQSEEDAKIKKKKGAKVVESVDLTSEEEDTGESLTINEDTILRDENDKKIDNKKPVERKVKRPVKEPDDKEVSDKEPIITSNLSIVSATNKGEVVGTPGNYKIPVTDEGNPIEPDPDTVTIDENIVKQPILLQPDLLLADDIIGTEVEFEIIENDWYLSDRLDKAEESWMEIPIYYKIGNSYIGKLEASTNLERKAIVDKLQKGQKVITKISEVMATNFNNAVDDTGAPVFFDPRDVFGKEDDILLGFTVAIKEGEILTYQWDLGEVDLDKDKDKDLDDIRREVQRDKKPELNQIAIVVRSKHNPQGIARISLASTANLNSMAQSKVLEALTNKNYSAAYEIVANSKVRVGAENNPSYLEFGEFEAKQGEERGEQYIVYNSPKLGKLIRINENELKKALDGTGKSSFNIVTEKNEKFVGTKTDTEKSDINIAEDLSVFLQSKKYNVIRDVGNLKTPYTSLVTGLEYPSYQHYLFASKELGDEERIDGVGHNSILSTDIVKKGESMFNSPRVVFEKGDLLGETAPEIIKNTKIDKTKPEVPAADRIAAIESELSKLNERYWAVDSSVAEGKIQAAIKELEAELAALKAKKAKVAPINIYAGTGENAHLSNFANRPFTPGHILALAGRDDVKFNTVEGAFQAAKNLYTTSGNKAHNNSIVAKLQTATGIQAKSLGRQIRGLDVKSWDEASPRVMKSLIYESFRQNPEALQELLATGNAELTHTQDKGKWGKLFPRILMEVRSELRTEAPAAKKTKTIKKSDNNQLDMFLDNLGDKCD